MEVTSISPKNPRQYLETIPLVVLWKNFWISNRYLRPNLIQMTRAAFHLTSNQCTKSDQYTKLLEYDGVREISLREPKTRNSLSLPMMEEILQHLCAEWHNKNLRCIIISSSGPIWSAGHDLKELSPECGVEQQTLVFEKLIQIVDNIRKAPVPVVAKVNGIVAAGGVQLVASCDMVICTANSSFVTPSANIGVFASTPAVAMSRLIPHNKCLDMLLTGHPITAQDALKYGIRVVPETDLDKEMDEIIKSIKNKSRAVLALGKEFFYKQLELPLEQAYRQAVKTFLPRYYVSSSMSTTAVGPPFQKYVEVTECDGVRKITLNDPKTRNSLSMAMMDSILEALCRDWCNKNLRCIILNAHGNVWSAGHNLWELGPCKPSKKQTEIFEKLTEIILNIYKMPVPVIAEVNGLAAAAGCQLVASCDFVIATDTSTFMTPGANFGIFCSTPGIAISRVMSRSKAAYMLLSGLPINAQEAYQAGLVSRLVSENDLEKEMCLITAAIKAKSRAVIALGKQFYYEQLQLPVKEAYRLGAETFVPKCFITSAMHTTAGTFCENDVPKIRKYVRVEEKDGVRELIIDDPTTNNSFSLVLMDTLLDAIRSDWSNKELRCIVLRSVIKDVWSIGYNLRGLVDCQQIEIFRKLNDIVLSMHEAPIPIIAEVNGLVAGAGCQLVASCDFVIATDKSTFITSGADIGLFCSTAGIALSRVMSRSKAAYMLMTGLPITSQEAYEADLVNRLVDERHLYKEMLNTTTAIKAKSRAVIALGKKFYYKQLQLPFEEAYRLGAHKMTENLALSDSKEGLKSFQKKRKPIWRHE
uniref:Enoyl-CoA hydratase domain-containing protein 3, mitochondrial n=1 Tax=Glossina brevipalpis TaxID=37001 RepID=A0A1A9WWT3_9MUSC